MPFTIFLFSLDFKVVFLISYSSEFICKFLMFSAEKLIHISTDQNKLIHHFSNV